MKKYFLLLAFAGLSTLAINVASAQSLDQLPPVITTPGGLVIHLQSTTIAGKTTYKISSIETPVTEPNGTSVTIQVTSGSLIGATVTPINDSNAATTVFSVTPAGSTTPLTPSQAAAAVNTSVTTTIRTQVASGVLPAGSTADTVNVFRTGNFGPDKTAVLAAASAAAASGDPVRAATVQADAAKILAAAGDAQDASRLAENAAQIVATQSFVDAHPADAAKVAATVSKVATDTNVIAANPGAAAAIAVQATFVASDPAVKGNSAAASSLGDIASNVSTIANNSSVKTAAPNLQADLGTATKGAQNNQNIVVNSSPTQTFDVSLVSPAG